MTENKFHVQLSDLKVKYASFRCRNPSMLRLQLNQYMQKTRRAYEFHFQNTKYYYREEEIRKTVLHSILITKLKKQLTFILLNN
jgi:hypothetical protein